MVEHINYKTHSKAHNQVILFKVDLVRHAIDFTFVEDGKSLNSSLKFSFVEVDDKAELIFTSTFIQQIPFSLRCFLEENSHLFNQEEKEKR